MDLQACAPVSLSGADARVSAAHNPAATLALLMDFSGSVALAELLHARSAELDPRAPHPNAACLARNLLDSVNVQLEQLALRALEPFSGEQAPAAPSLVELEAALARVAGAARVPKGPAAIARLARSLGEPYHVALSASLQKTEAKFAALRLRIAPALRELGPRADRLERIDAALQRSLQLKLAELFDRMPLFAARAFERACAEACAALPADFEAPALSAWLAADGFIEAHRARCVAMAQALSLHLRRNLEGLLQAAIHAEVA